MYHWAAIPALDWRGQQRTYPFSGNKGPKRRKKIMQRKKLRNAALRAEIVNLKNHTQAIEAIARSDLGMIQDGEILYIFPEN